jgi:hypothetical protein
MRRREFIALGASAVALQPAAVLAQRRKAAVVGILSVFSPGPAQTRTAAFRQGLEQAGYVEGRNLTIEYRWPSTVTIGCPALPPISSAARSMSSPPLARPPRVRQKMRPRRSRSSLSSAPTRSRTALSPASPGPAAT